MRTDVKPKGKTRPLTMLRKAKRLTLRGAVALLSAQPGVHFRTHTRLLKLEREGFDSIALMDAMANVYGVDPDDVRLYNEATKAHRK